MVCMSCRKNEVHKFGELCPTCQAWLESIRKTLPEREPEPDDGITTMVPLPQRVPGEPPREVARGRNTSYLWAALRFLGLDGWGQ